MHYIYTYTLSFYSCISPWVIPPIPPTCAKGSNCKKGIKIFLMKYWASTWQDVRKSLQLFFCFILARWVIFSNNTFAQSLEIQHSWIVKATSLSTGSAGLYNICKNVYESQTWWRIQLIVWFVYQIEHHFNGVYANRFNQAWHQFNNSPGCQSIYRGHDPQRDISWMAAASVTAGLLFLYQHTSKTI